MKMKFARISKALGGVAVLALISTVASADPWNKKTTLTVKETIEVPGAVLTPGEYVVKLVGSDSNRHIVQFLNKEENEVLSTVLAIPNTRLQVTGDTAFAWHETPAGQPPAMKAWFYPGDNFGQEFAYPDGRAAELSAATKQEVAHVTEQEAKDAANYQPQEETVIAQAPAPRTQQDSSAAQTAQQTRERETAAQRERDMQAQRDRERQAAQTAAQNQQRNADPSVTAQQDQQRNADPSAAQQTQQQRNADQGATTQQNQQRNADPNATAQQNQQSSSTGNELPQTAGLGVLLALIGLGALGASRAVRKLRTK